MQTTIPIDLIPLNVALYKAYDDDFIFIDVNIMVEETENISKELLMGEKVTEVFPGIKEMGLFDIFTRVHATGKSEVLEMAHYKDGRISGWRKNTVTKIDEYTIMAAYEDVSSLADRQKTEAALKKLNDTLEERVQEEILQNRQKDKHLIQQSPLAQMGEMLSMIAHQWRQPLSAISATSNNLQLKLMIDDIDKKEFNTEIALISNYSQHLSQTIDDFRGFLKNNKEKERTSLDAIVKTTLTIAQVSAENKNITIKTDLNADVTLETFANELNQVLLNLIKNAQDALLDNNIIDPTIMIVTSVKDNIHILKVKDNAGGIPADVIDKIFDPYFSTKKEKDGTGLGLYMSKTIVQEHCQGDITVTNGKDGAEFTIQIKGNL